MRRPSTSADGGTGARGDEAPRALLKRTRATIGEAYEQAYGQFAKK
jgi:hypothetical protein